MTPSTNNLGRLQIVKEVPNAEHRWWNLKPRFISQTYYLKVNSEGYVIIIKED